MRVLLNIYLIQWNLKSEELYLNLPKYRLLERATCENIIYQCFQKMLNFYFLSIYQSICYQCLFFIVVIVSRLFIYCKLVFFNKQCIRSIVAIKSHPQTLKAQTFIRVVSAVVDGIVDEGDWNTKAVVVTRELRDVVAGRHRC